MSGGGGGNPRERGVNLLFNKISDENCMKIKEIGPRAGHASPAPFGCATATSVNFIQCLDELEMSFPWWIQRACQGRAPLSWYTLMHFRDTFGQMIH